MGEKSVMKRLSQDHVNRIAQRARALGETARVRLVETLSRGKHTVGQLATALGMQQSTASKHLQVLYHAGLVQRQRSASMVIYSLMSRDVVAWCRYLGHRQLARPRSRTAGARARMNPTRTRRTIATARPRTPR
jgi:DNA-binding transcriptional ArsR family regulator